VNMTFAEADALPPYVVLSEPQVFQHGTIRTTIPPGYLVQDQMMVLRMIKDSYPGRPIYFSFRSTGVGLEDYLVASGLAYKLMPTPVTETEDIRNINGEMMDVPKTLDLWNNVFQGQKSLIAQKRWMDRPSISIPFRYALTGLTLAEATRQMGDTAQADRLMETVKQIAETAGITQYLPR
jgi:hypothetical protein